MYNIAIIDDNLLFERILKMNINLIAIDANKTIGKNPVLVDVAPAYVYENGKRTGEVSGFKYTVALPDKAFEKLTIKIDGENRLSDFIEWSENMLSKECFEIVLGEGYSGRVSVNISKIPHMLIGGSTGSGKSILLKLVLMQCVKKGAKIYIADFKGGVDFPNVWHKKCFLLTDEETLLKVLIDVTTELKRRKQILRNAAFANIDEYNRNTEKKLQRIIFACDEIAEVLDKTGLTKQQKDEILKIESELSLIARQGRAFGIHLVLATQRPDAGILNGQIRNNIDTRICGRADNVLSQIILDSTDATDLIAKSSQGRFLTNSGKIFQAYWFDENIL